MIRGEVKIYLYVEKRFTKCFILSACLSSGVKTLLKIKNE